MQATDCVMHHKMYAKTGKNSRQRKAEDNLMGMCSWTEENEYLFNETYEKNRAECIALHEFGQTTGELSRI